ncbi:uncharacterized protein OCT59_024783 [Rhizophagus irregularis]|uniref:uncharacterized protein n=1 Tax=Rhizophagus irregularis TaxID=588596 RepID=UPI00331ADAB5|nr:hypothetical protein OCT59_024783 [Rhizophagus irregularis]
MPWIISMLNILGKFSKLKMALCVVMLKLSNIKVDMQLWYFNGGFIVNKRSCFVLDAAGWKCQNGELFSEYYFVSLIPQLNYKDNFIHLKFNRNFVLDVSGAKTDNSTNIHLWEKHGGKNQQFILQKWDDGSAVIENAETNIIDNFKFLPKLSQNFLEILNDDEYYDHINIEVGDNPHVKTFHAHMVILSHRSPYLRRKLSTNKKNNDGTLTRIELPNILPEIFVIILRYIYSGKLSLKEIDPTNIIKLLVAANELSLQELVTYIQSFLIENKANWMKQNFDLIYQTSYEIDSFLDLQSYYNDLISNEPDIIFKSPQITVIQNDNLQISEIQVWEHVLKWGVSQNSAKLPSNLRRF